MAFCKLCYTIVNRLLSTNTLIIILFISVICLIFYCITLGLNSDSGMEQDITILTVSFALASIVPYFVGRTIAKNEIDKIIDEKFNERFNALTTEYSTSIFTLRKNNAHTRRIAANLLKGQTDADKEWAIGWAAEAIIDYALIHAKYNNSVRYAKECTKIFKAEDSNEPDRLLLDFNPATPPETNEDKKDIHERTLKSILSMHAITDIYDFHKYRPTDEELLKIEHALFQWAYNADNVSPKTLSERIIRNCKISDIPNSINDEVAKKVKGYLANITDGAKS